MNMVALFGLLVIAVAVAIAVSLLRLRASNVAAGSPIKSQVLPLIVRELLFVALIVIVLIVLVVMGVAPAWAIFDGTVATLATTDLAVQLTILSRREMYPLRKPVSVWALPVGWAASAAILVVRLIVDFSYRLW